MNRFACPSQVLEIIHGREMGRFAGLFVFNALAAVSFRANRENPYRSGRRGAAPAARASKPLNSRSFCFGPRRGEKQQKRNEAKRSVSRRQSHLFSMI